MSSENQLVRGLSALVLILAIVGGLRTLDRVGRPGTLTALEMEGVQPRVTWQRSREPIQGAQLEALTAGTSLDVNAVTEDELTILPGVGPSLARRIIDYRDSIGAFRDVSQLVEVRGVGPRRLATWRHLLRVEPAPVEGR